MKPTLDVMEKERSTLRLIVLLFIGAMLNFFLLIPSIPTVVVVLTSTSQPFPSVSEQQVGYIVAYGLLSVPYCAGATVAFKPKRFVSPLYVQVITFVLASSPLFYYLFANAAYASIDQLVQVLGRIAYGLGAFLLVIGLYQEISVRWLVGVSNEGYDPKTFILQKDFGKMKDFFLNSDFLKSWELKIIENANDRMVVRAKRSLRNSTVMVLTHDEGGNHSILATCAFRATRDVVKKDGPASRRRDRIVNAIRDEFDCPYWDTDLNNRASSRAERITLEGTEARWAKIGGLPRPYMGIVLGIIGVLALATLVQLFFYSNLELYLIIISSTFVSAFVELAPPLLKALRAQTLEQD